MTQPCFGLLPNVRRQSDYVPDLQWYQEGGCFHVWLALGQGPAANPCEFKNGAQGLNTEDSQISDAFLNPQYLLMMPAPLITFKAGLELLTHMYS